MATRNLMLGDIAKELREAADPWSDGIALQAAAHPTGLLVAENADINPASLVSMEFEEAACDGCGAKRLFEPRFKGMVTRLCSQCFAAKGRERTGLINVTDEGIALERLPSLYGTKPGDLSEAEFFDTPLTAEEIRARSQLIKELQPPPFRQEVQRILDADTEYRPLMALAPALSLHDEKKREEEYHRIALNIVDEIAWGLQEEPRAGTRNVLENRICEALRVAAAQVEPQRAVKHDIERKLMAARAEIQALRDDKQKLEAVDNAALRDGKRWCLVPDGDPDARWFRLRDQERAARAAWFREGRVPLTGVEDGAVTREELDALGWVLDEFRDCWRNPMVATEKPGDHPYHGPVKPHDITGEGGEVMRTERRAVPDEVHERFHKAVGDVISGKVMPAAREQMKRELERAPPYAPPSSDPPASTSKPLPGSALFAHQAIGLPLP